MTRLLRFGLVAAPLGATVGAFGGYVAAAHSCDTGHPGGARTSLVILAVLGLVLAIAGLMSARRSWQASAPAQPPDIFPDRENVNAFLARAGLLMGGVFLIGLIYLVIGPFLVQACEKIW